MMQRDSLKERGNDDYFLHKKKDRWWFPTFFTFCEALETLILQMTASHATASIL